MPSLNSEWSQPYILGADLHTNRTLLNKQSPWEAKFKGGVRGAGGARRPEFEFDVAWKHTPGNRHIFIYTKVPTRSDPFRFFFYCSFVCVWFFGGGWGGGERSLALILTRLL